MRYGPVRLVIPFKTTSVSEQCMIFRTVLRVENLAETIYPSIRAFPDLLETVFAAVYTRFLLTDRCGQPWSLSSWNSAFRNRVPAFTLLIRDGRRRERPGISSGKIRSGCLERFLNEKASTGAPRATSEATSLGLALEEVGGPSR